VARHEQSPDRVLLPRDFHLKRAAPRIDRGRSLAQGHGLGLECREHAIDFRYRAFRVAQRVARLALRRSLLVQCRFQRRDPRTQLGQVTCLGFGLGARLRRIGDGAMVRRARKCGD